MNVVIRNIVGLTGVTPLCGRVADAHLSRIGPLLWVAFSPIGTRWGVPWWAWIAQSHAAVSASGITTVPGLAGAVLMCRYVSQDAIGEETQLRVALV